MYVCEAGQYGTVGKVCTDGSYLVLSARNFVLDKGLRESSTCVRPRECFDK